MTNGKRDGSPQPPHHMKDNQHRRSRTDTGKTKDSGNWGKILNHGAELRCGWGVKAKAYKQGGGMSRRKEKDESCRGGLANVPKWT